MRRPRFWRIVLWLLLLALTIAGVMAWRIAHDRAQLTALIQDAARDALALDLRVGEPAEVAFWPHLGVRLRGVEVLPLGGDAALLSADALDADVPWSALWASELRLGGVRVRGARIDAEQLDAWIAGWRNPDAGPPAPLRWPRLDNRIEITDAIWHDVQTDTRFDASVSAVQLGAPLALRVIVHDEAKPLSLELHGTPSHRPDGIALDGISASIASPAAPSATLSLVGAAYYGNEQNWRARAQITATRWPAWLNAYAGAKRDAPIQLDTQLFAQGARTWLVVTGRAGGSQLSGRLSLDALPAADNTQAWLDTLAHALRGRMQIDKIEIDGVQLEGITIETSEDEPAETSTQ